MEQWNPDYEDWHEHEDPVDEFCNDGELPDGPRCPKCGQERGPSGVDGGSWVHIRPHHNSVSTVSTRQFNYNRTGLEEHLFTADYEVQQGHVKTFLASKKKFNLLSEKTGKFIKMRFHGETDHGITYVSEEKLGDNAHVAVYFNTRPR